MAIRSPSNRTSRAWSQGRRAAALGNLRPLLLEGGDPFLEGREARLRTARIAQPQRDTRSREQVAQLGVGKLIQQVRQELPPGFADRRIVERAGQRLRQVAHASRVTLPDWR